LERSAADLDWQQHGGYLEVPDSDRRVDSDPLGYGVFPSDLYKKFVLLPLNHEGELRKFVNDWGLPVRDYEVRENLTATREFCPVLKMQFEILRLRLLLRLVTEVLRPLPDRAALHKLVGEFEQLVGDIPSGGAFGLGREHGGDDWGNWGNRRGAEGLSAAAALINWGFAESLANVEHMVLVVETKEGQRYLRREWKFRLSKRSLLDYLYLQAYEQLAENLLLKCNCGRCGETLFFGTTRQVKLFEKQCAVYIDGHKDKRLKKSSPEERAKARNRMRKRRAK
jgi:hypothetical protein